MNGPLSKFRYVSKFRALQKLSPTGAVRRHRQLVHFHERHGPDLCLISSGLKGFSPLLCFFEVLGLGFRFIGRVISIRVYWASKV